MVCFCRDCKKRIDKHTNKPIDDWITDFQFACLPWFEHETVGNVNEAPHEIKIGGKLIRFDQLGNADMKFAADANLVNFKKISIHHNLEIPGEDSQLCDQDAIVSIVLKKDPWREVNGWSPVHQFPLDCTPVGLRHNGKCVRVMFASTFHETKKVNGVRITKVSLAIRVFDGHQSPDCADLPDDEDDDCEWNLQNEDADKHYEENDLHVIEDQFSDEEKGKIEADVQNPHCWWSRRAGVSASECGLSKKDWAELFQKSGLLSSESIKTYVDRAYLDKYEDHENEDMEEDETEVSGEEDKENRVKENRFP